MPATSLVYSVVAPAALKKLVAHSYPLGPAIDCRLLALILGLLLAHVVPIDLVQHQFGHRSCERVAPILSVEDLVVVVLYSLPDPLEPGVVTSMNGRAEQTAPREWIPGTVVESGVPR